MTPRELTLLMCVPAMLTLACWTSTPAISSACSMTFLIDSTVASRLMTTPLRTPFDSVWAAPTTLRRRSSIASAMIAHTLWVPMSSPVMYRSFFRAMSSGSLFSGT